MAEAAIEAPLRRPARGPAGCAGEREGYPGGASGRRIWACRRSPPGRCCATAVALGSALGRKVEGIMASGALVDDGTDGRGRPGAPGPCRRRRRLPPRWLPADDRAGSDARRHPRRAPGASSMLWCCSRCPEAVLVERAIARQRADDREEVVRERLRVYREKTEPLVEHYERRRLAPQGRRRAVHAARSRRRSCRMLGGRA